MNLENLKVIGVDKISVTDSLSAPLLSFKLQLNNNTVIPNDSNLQILVKQNNMVKTYQFELPAPLTVDDAIIMEPIYEKNKVTMKTILEKENEKINLPSLRIDLFEGYNEISTNYQNCLLEILYPKDIELVKYFLMTTFASVIENNSLTLDDLYFKDAFTNELGKLNLEVNHMTIDCLSSKNNTFLLDDLGNLSVNSLTTKEKESDTSFNNLTIKSLTSQNGKFQLDANGNLTVNSITSTSTPTTKPNFNLIYPVGSIYMSVNATNPQILFGGTWTSIAQGRTLFGVDTSQTEFQTVKKTGGAKNVALTTENLPHLSGTISNHGAENGSTLWSPTGVFQSSSVIQNKYRVVDKVVNGASSIQSITFNVGNNQPHNNLPPYFTCYIWQRVS